jgi:glycosyltransferase involved in cell wall biosynthesis
MTEQVLVSIYMPTHNRAEILPRAVESVLAQTYQHIELIIVDDGSTDGTWQYLNELANSNNKVKVFRHEQALGACAARNLALRNALGKFVTGIDDDDEFCVDRVASLVSEYDANYAFINTGFLWDYGKQMRAVDNQAMTISLQKQLDYNYATNQILVETKRLLAIGGFDESFVACQDYDTWTRLIQQFGSAKRISGASYVIHRGDDISRLTEPTNWLKGHAQFMVKHEALMDSNNKLNQEFREMIARRKKMTVKQLFFQLHAGLISQKIRYFLSSNLHVIAEFRRKFLEK